MLRHFGQDPTPAEIMRNEGPAVFAWLGRVWHAQASGRFTQFVDTVPGEATPMLQEIAQTHLVQLTANAQAHAAQQQRFEMRVQGCHARNTRRFLQQTRR